MFHLMLPRAIRFKHTNHFVRNDKACTISSHSRILEIVLLSSDSEALRYIHILSMDLTITIDEFMLSN